MEQEETSAISTVEEKYMIRRAREKEHGNATVQ